MNLIQSVIDRQLGIYCRFNYDFILRRLVVSEEESFYGLQAGGAPPLDHDPPIFACRFAECCGYEHVLALANEDGRVALQDTSKIGRAASLEGFQCHNNAVFDLAWMPANMNFVTVSGDHTACLWDITDGAPQRVSTFAAHTKSVKTAVFRPADPAVFATGARDGHVLVWDIRASNQPAIVLKPDNSLMNCHNSFTPKTPGSHGKRTRTEPRRALSITGLAFQSATTLLSCAECDGNIKAWDLRKSYSGHTRSPLPAHAIPYCGCSARHGYSGLALDAARVRLYASCMDDVIYCFNVAAHSVTPERRYVGHENRSFYIKASLSPDGAYLLSGSSDTHAYVWSVTSARPSARLAGHRAEVTCAAWRAAAAGEPAVATCSDDARHMLWRLGPEVSSPGGRRAAAGRAEPAPLAPPASPRWRADTRTPASRKRNNTDTPTSVGVKRARALETASARRTKRCLVDSMNAADSPKRTRTELSDPEAIQTGIKRHSDFEDTVPCKLQREEPSTSDRTHVTPKKSGERKVLSPRSDNTPPFSPLADLPNFVLRGEAPHLRLMSPVKPKRDAPDWLTRLTRERQGRVTDGPADPAPNSPKENIPMRRNSTAEKTPKSKKTRTLLKYFNVAVKEK